MKSHAVVILIVLGAAASAGEVPLYRASLATPTSQRIIARDLAWTCVGPACAAPRTASSSDANVCSSIARKVGPLTGFASGERVFAAEELARCNQSVR